MQLRSLLLLILTAGCLAASVRGDRAAPLPGRAAPVRSRLAALPTSPTRPVASAPSFSRVIPWRYRIKSVLEEKDLTASPTADLGPAAILEPDTTWLHVTHHLIHSPTVRPLRC